MGSVLSSESSVRSQLSWAELKITQLKNTSFTRKNKGLHCVTLSRKKNIYIYINKYKGGLEMLKDLERTAAAESTAVSCTCMSLRATTCATLQRCRQIGFVFCWGSGPFRAFPCCPSQPRDQSTPGIIHIKQEVSEKYVEERYGTAGLGAFCVPRKQAPVQQILNLQ